MAGAEAQGAEPSRRRGRAGRRSRPEAPPVAEAGAGRGATPRSPSRRPRPSPSRRAGSLPPTMTRPVAVAITGGIGAGKSEALEAFARHGAATVSSDEIVHTCCGAPEVSDAVVERMGTASSRPTARSTAARSRRRLQRPGSARLARGAPAPARLAPNTSSGASSSASCRRAARVRDRGAAPLRDRRRRPVRQGRRDHRAVEAAPRALGRRDGRSRGAAARRPREGAARGLRVHEHRHARGARRVRRVRDARAAA